mmetsp:Transcript_34316/g.49867  ORF Transcript_34316/g.49867 Transcript_34316/m.49867 type:complete len:91 (+) Transcript_34316:1638-1910(+)
MQDAFNRHFESDISIQQETNVMMRREVSLQSCGCEQVYLTIKGSSPVDHAEELSEDTNEGLLRPSEDHPTLIFFCLIFFFIFYDDPLKSH